MILVSPTIWQRDHRANDLGTLAERKPNAGMARLVSSQFSRKHHHRGIPAVGNSPMDARLRWSLLSSAAVVAASVVVESVSRARLIVGNHHPPNGVSSAVTSPNHPRASSLPVRPFVRTSTRVPRRVSNMRRTRTARQPVVSIRRTCAVIVGSF